MVCLLFPFLIESPLVVLAMAAGLAALFALAGRLGALRSLHGVGRAGRGAELFPLAVFLVYFVARERPWLYVAALLTLAVGDAAAALVGVRYGAVRYEVEDSPKSLEGSAAFLVVAFLTIHLPALLMSDLPRPVSVLAALLVALLVTGFEAISLGGTDNLFVPLAVVVVLGKITTKPLGEIAFQLASLALIYAVIAIVAWRRRSLNVGGAIAFTLFAYGAWSLGNWQWALPPLLGFTLFVATWFGGGRARELPAFKVRAVVRAVLVPFLLIACANGVRDGARFFGPYLAACGAALCFALWAGVFRTGRRLVPAGGARSLVGALATAVIAALAVVLPAVLIQRPAPAAPLSVLAAVVATALLQLLWERIAPARRDRGGELAPAGPSALEWDARRFLLVAAAAALVLALQQSGAVPAWDPSWAPRPW